MEPPAPQARRQRTYELIPRTGSHNLPLLVCRASWSNVRCGIGHRAGQRRPAFFVLRKGGCHETQRRWAYRPASDRHCVTADLQELIPGVSRGFTLKGKPTHPRREPGIITVTLFAGHAVFHGVTDLRGVATHLAPFTARPRRRAGAESPPPKNKDKNAAACITV